MSACHRLCLFSSLAPQQQQQQQQQHHQSLSPLNFPQRPPHDGVGILLRPEILRMNSNVQCFSLSFSSASFIAACLSRRFRARIYPRSLHFHGAVCLQAVHNLPSKLQEIVKLFEVVPEPRAKYEQLLHYGKKLNPLAKVHQTRENKVNGCVSQVWVRASLGPDNKVYFEAESDSLLTKGLAALLVEGLSGSSPSEILKISPDFIQMLGLNQSLTPSRSNGFLNMLKLMQKKALQLYMEAEREGVSKSSGVEDNGNGLADALPSREDQRTPVSTRQIENVRASGIPSRQDSIRQKLETGLDPITLEIEDVSYQHAGHAGVQKGATETHFNVKIVSPKFEGRTLVKRHRLVYDMLREELEGGLHALSIVAKTPAEVERG